jgi:CBS domain-containing protein
MQSAVRQLLDDKGRDVATVGPEASVVDAVERMNRRGIGSLVVTDGGRVVGMFTERDVLVRIVAAGADPAATPVRQVMTTDVVTIQPETTVKAAMMMMTERRCRHLPVLDHGQLAGLISIGDVTRWNLREQADHIADLEAYVMRG